MTDVRLTALNPEDSQAYPVACNSSGELLVSQGVESDKYVEKSGDNMTGDLTLGTDKISLKAADGSAEYAGVISTGGASSSGIGASGGRMRHTGDISLRKDGGSAAVVEVFQNGDGTADKKVIINNDGSASFASGNANISGAGVIYVSRDAGTQQIFGGGFGGDNTKFQVFADGSANFAGDVVIGSRNKRWMIVEQSGLAHLVEQVTFDRKAYPKLRDIPGELDLVEKALSEVMEKLRLVPPAGWPVWDGSDET